MFNLRQKLSIGFGGLLLLLALIGGQSISLLSDLGQSIDVILRENYRSVLACQDMKEALERMDSGALFCLLGYEQGKVLLADNKLKFEQALAFELSNITLPGEEKAELIQSLFTEYTAVVQEFLAPHNSPASRQKLYFDKQLPLFYKTKDAANAVLQLNQQNMSDANDRARARAAAARQQMGALLFAGAIFSVSFIFFTRRWILHPIKRLMQSAEEIRRGNLELCLGAHTNDEIGRLSAAFNDMVQSLREFRRSDQTKLTLLQRSAQEAFKNIPEITAIIDLDGIVDVSTDMARIAFGLNPGAKIQDSPHEWLRSLYAEARSASGAASDTARKIFQWFINGKEYFFEPHAAPVLDAGYRVAGVRLSFKDVTQQQEHDAMKRGLVSTVSHQLKTPLTSIRMAIHLLLEEKVGALDEKQAELLLAARDDSDRLHTILEDLLDIGRIESGKSPMCFEAIAPQTLAAEAVGRFAAAGHDKGIALTLQVSEALPAALADRTRIGHVFDNLLSNALKYTTAGGAVTLSAHADEEHVIFTVCDTGCGIPEAYLNKVFTQFFRVPGQETPTGAGLGLAIAREIVEAHGGTISVASAEGTGTCFTFTLKRAKNSDIPGASHE